MRFPFTASLLLGLSVFCATAAAQQAPRQTSTAANSSTQRLALATAATEAAPVAAAAPAPVVCQAVTGQVLTEDGEPLIGASILVKGTRIVSITNAEGHYTFDVPLQATQVLRVSSSGFADREVQVKHCSPMVVALEMLPGTRIKQTGRNKGKIIVVGQAE